MIFLYLHLQKNNASFSLIERVGVNLKQAEDTLENSMIITEPTEKKNS